MLAFELSNCLFWYLGSLEWRLLISCFFVGVSQPASPTWYYISQDKMLPFCPIFIWQMESYSKECLSTSKSPRPATSRCLQPITKHVPSALPPTTLGKASAGGIQATCYCVLMRTRVIRWPVLCTHREEQHQAVEGLWACYIPCLWRWQCTYYTVVPYVSKQSNSMIEDRDMQHPGHFFNMMPRELRCHPRSSTADFTCLC
ncbi:hypothetical protein F4680DRAFT_32840 [Xylaria scruposa]|nr:hypothetical protein F4680DRAFT_32840 [Xylaria scruposa]